MDSNFIINIFGCIVAIIVLSTICFFLCSDSEPAHTEPAPYAICPYCGVNLTSANCGGVCCADAKN